MTSHRPVKLTEAPYYRKCELGVCEPTIELFGCLYGVCPLAHECPRDISCGYANRAALRSHKGTET